MMEGELRQHRCCFTGHRPEKLSSTETEICKALERTILTAYADGYRTFITGMAKGVDIWAGEIVVAARSVHPEIRLICAMPHPNFGAKWADEWRVRSRELLSVANLVKVVSPACSMACYQRRNEWMVDHSARVIAVYNGVCGGTKNTLDYAAKCGVEIVNAIE